jgi:hypothetical protein
MANTTFNGPVRAEGGFKQITKNATTGVITENYSVSTTGQVTAATSTTIFQYNYITCPPPITSMMQNSAVGVLADGDKFGCFSGQTVKYILQHVLRLVHMQQQAQHQC